MVSRRPLLFVPLLAVAAWLLAYELRVTALPDLDFSPLSSRFAHDVVLALTAFICLARATPPPPVRDYAPLARRSGHGVGRAPPASLRPARAAGGGGARFAGRRAGWGVPPGGGGALYPPLGPGHQRPPPIPSPADAGY